MRLTLNDFIAKWLGKKLDYDNAFGGQCMDVYRMYVKEVLGLPQSPPVEGAKNVWDTYLKDHYDRIVNTPDGVPPAGAIVIWGGTYGPYGHIAIVISATATEMTCFSQNDPIGTVCQIRKYGYKHVLGWLVAKSQADTISIDKSVFEELVRKSSAFDEALRALDLPGDATADTILKSLAGTKGLVGTLQREKAEAQQEVKNREEQLAYERAECQRQLTISFEAEKAAKKEREAIQGNYDQLKGEWEQVRRELGQRNNELAACRAGNPTYCHTIGRLFGLCR